MSGSALQALLASIGFAEIPPDSAIEAQLRKLFVYYCSSDNVDSLSPAKFAKLARDAGVADARLSKAELDLLFVRASQAAKPSIARSSSGLGNKPPPPSKAKLALGFEQFLEVLYDIAARKYGLATEARSLALPNGRRGLPLLLSEHLLPLAQRGAGGGGAGGGGAGDGGGAAARLDDEARALLELNTATLRSIFAHYCSPARPATPRGPHGADACHRRRPRRRRPRRRRPRRRRPRRRHPRRRPSPLRARPP